MYECGECRNNTLVIRAVPDLVIAGRWAWDVTCGRGHRLTPVIGAGWRPNSIAGEWSHLGLF